MRVFAAFALPADVSAGIRGAFSHARTLASKVRWVPDEGMHVTLHFFGEVPEDRIPGFSAVFEDPELQRPVIRARLGAVGFFPPSGSPRVLWVGLQEGAGEMNAFWKLFTEKLQQLRRADGPLGGWAPDGRGFFAHITVARSGSTPLDAQWARDVRVPPDEFMISGCVLFQSLLGSGGAKYVPLKTVHFTGGAA